MDYSFNVEVAQKYGVNEAIFMHNLYFWIFKNEANERHFYEGRYWTYNSAEAFSKLFPFWGADQIKRIIKKLREKNLVLVGDFNKNKFFRPNWYALSGEILKIYQSPVLPNPLEKPRDDMPGENHQHDRANSPNGESGFAPSDGAIPHHLTDSKPDGKPDVNSFGAKKPPRQKKGEFIKPTLAEVAEYCRKRQNNVDPKRFFDYYNEAEWVDRNGDPVRSWKQKMIANWEDGNASTQKPSVLDGEADDVMATLYGGRRSD